MPVGEGATYTLMRVGGRDVCGLSPMSEEQRALGASPAWLSHASVEDADLARLLHLDRPGRCGGSDRRRRRAGRAARDADPVRGILVARDPQGAHFALVEGDVDP